MKKQLSFFAVLFLIGLNEIYSQNSSHFINDSLVGFDEPFMKRVADSKGVTPEELPYFMALHKRDFLKQKYNLRSAPSLIQDYSEIAKTAAAGCVNEDFEDASLTSTVPGTIAVTTATTINGWAASGGTTAATTTGNCLLPATFTPNQTNAIVEHAPGPSGLTDLYIGPTYPIHSIYGSSLNINATSAYGYNCYGDWFVRVNHNLGPSGVRRITKTMTVSASNYIFDFAYLLVGTGNHCCCENSGLSIFFKDCSGNTLAGVNQYTLSYPQPMSCPSTLYPNMNCFYITPEDSVGTDTFYTCPANINYVYTKWKRRSVNLSAYIGTCVKIEVNAFSCTYIGHIGYCYFDAQCGNGTATNINSINNKTLYKVYPNPNAGNFNIDVSKEINNGEIELRNVLGQVVHRQNVKQGSNQIKTENLAKGIYNYSVLQDKEIVSVGKVVVE